MDRWLTMNCAHGHYAGECNHPHCQCECHAMPTIKETQNTFTIRWSRQDNEWVATSNMYPSLSHLDDNPQAALHGLIGIIRAEQVT